MVPVKSVKEYDRQLDVAVLFSECLTKLAFVLGTFILVMETKYLEQPKRAILSGNKLMTVTQTLLLHFHDSPLFGKILENVSLSNINYKFLRGLLYYPEGALNTELPKEDISEMFRHFHKLLILVRNLLLSLNEDELARLEQKLVSGSEEYVPTATVRALEQQIGNL